MPTNEEVESQRQRILALLRANEPGLTMDMICNEIEDLDIRTLERRLRILRNRKVVDTVGGVWFATTEAAKS